MKKYISLALATAAAIACSKVAPEDISPIESLPQDENTENIQGEPSGEKIIISLAQTKVSLDGDGCYQFDGDEVIYVKARTTGAVAKLQKSADEKNTFTGVFNGLLGDTSETFDFYYNCTDESANVVKVQNGQPWLAAIGVKGDRDRSTASEYSYKLSDVMLKQLDGYVCLALNSKDPCTVDFHTLTTALPNGETTISGIQLGSGSKKPYFVNIASGMTGGFYLTVTNPEGKKMYTSYGTAATITSNQIINTKSFEAFSGVSNLKITGFETTYSYYMDGKSETDPNGKVNSWMNGGTVTFSLSGISSSLVDVKFNDGDNDVTGTLKKSGSSFKYTFGSTENHTTFGAKTLTATVSFKAGIESGAATETTTVRHITGLPYNKDNADITNFASDWVPSGGKSEYRGNYLRYANCTVSFKGFFIPTDIKTVVSYYISGYVSTLFNPITTVFNIAEDDAINDKKEGTAKEFSYQTTRNVTFTNTKNTMYAKANCMTPVTWAQSFDDLRYVGVVYDSAQ